MSASRIPRRATPLLAAVPFDVRVIATESLGPYRDPRPRETQLREVAHHEAGHIVAAAAFRMPVGSLAVWESETGAIVGGSYPWRWSTGVAASNADEGNAVIVDCVVNAAGPVAASLAVGVISRLGVESHRFDTLSLASHYRAGMTYDEAEAIAKAAEKKAAECARTHWATITALATELLAQPETGVGRVRQLRSRRVVDFLSSRLPDIPGQPVGELTEGTRFWDPFA